LLIYLMKGVNSMNRYILMQAARVDGKLYFKEFVIEAKSRTHANKIAKGMLHDPDNKLWCRFDLTRELKA
jgi:hypothetical protein